MATLERLLKKPIPAILLVSLAILAIALLDYALGDAYSLFLLYIFPIYSVSWYNGRIPGGATACLCSLSWMAVDSLLQTLPQGSIAIAFTGVSRTALFCLMAVLFSSYKGLRETLQKQARIDQKTGAYNYHAFLELAQREVLRSKREDTRLVLCYFDMDHFKEVNDTYGHSEGDRVLVVFSRTVEENIRSLDIFARIGGDEFLLLFVDMDIRDADLALNRIRTAFREAMEQMARPVTVSIGATDFFPPDSPLEAIIHTADQLMYQAKNQGRDGIRTNWETRHPEPHSEEPPR